jgi:hypothetical protein
MFTFLRIFLNADVNHRRRLLKKCYPDFRFNQLRHTLILQLLHTQHDEKDLSQYL